MKISKNVIVALLIIGIISFGFKIYFVDFTIPVQHDNFEYAIRGIAHSQGDFSQSPKKMSGWPIFTSPFFLLVDSDNFLDYSNTLRLLGMSVSTLTIIPMYGLSRKFFDQKFSIVAASLFAFEPHLNYNSSFGFSEPLYIVTIILSFYFIVNNKEKFSYISFIFAGFVWWIRIEGFIIFIAISIIFLFNFKKTSWHIPKYGLCILVFLIVISPILIIRADQYGDPFYFYYNENLFVNDYYTTSISESLSPNFIDEKVPIELIPQFILAGFYNILYLFSRILFPYLIVLLPFGIFFSLHTINQDTKLIKVNWIFILTCIGLLAFLLYLVPERRFLFFLLPFLIIFAVIPIQRVVEYGLNTFSFTEKKKKTILLGVIIGVIILSGLFNLRFEKLDVLEEREKIEFAKFLVHDLDGDILGSSETEHVSFIKLTETSSGFKNYRIDVSKEPFMGFPYTTGNKIFRLEGESIVDLLSYGNENDIKFLIVKEKNPDFEYLDSVYNKEENYIFLKKIFDSNESGYTNLKFKVFEINYEKFHEIYS